MPPLAVNVPPLVPVPVKVNVPPVIISEALFEIVKSVVPSATVRDPPVAIVSVDPTVI